MATHTSVEQTAIPESRISNCGQTNVLHGQSLTSNRCGGGGCTAGSQGYSASNCTALVAAVKKIFPLGSQEWTKVQDLYNVYAAENNWISHEADPL